MFLHRFGKSSAPEFPNEITWLNGKPKTIKSLEGKVILIDFWTYSCVNCLRTLEHVKKWHRLYKKHGLVVIGVHTPEFSFEKNEEHVKNALERLGIKYPVILDNEYKIWNLYSNRWWPRKILLDMNGSVVYDHIGEGGYAETERAIQKALVEMGANNLPEVELDVPVGEGLCHKTTKDLYMGFARGRFGNIGSSLPNMEQVYTDLREYQDDTLYLHGHWKVESEALIHTKKIALTNEYLALRYSAFSVNAVIGTDKKRAVLFEIELDGHPVPEDMFGDDVKMKNGKSVVRVKDSKMYSLIRSDIYHKGVLRIKTADSGLIFYELTFGGCKGM